MLTEDHDINCGIDPLRLGQDIGCTCHLAADKAREERCRHKWIPGVNPATWFERNDTGAAADAEGSRVLTLVEAAERLGVQPGSLRVQIAKGKLKARKIGRDWTVTEREVERYAKENRRERG